MWLTKDLENDDIVWELHNEILHESINPRGTHVSRGILYMSTCTAEKSRSIYENGVHSVLDNGCSITSF